MERLSVVAGIMLLLIIWVSFVYVLFVMKESGPYCPGMDPAWLGYCDDEEALK